jgi:hypothetical protein
VTAIGNGPVAGEDGSGLVGLSFRVLDRDNTRAFLANRKDKM